MQNINLNMGIAQHRIPLELRSLSGRINDEDKVRCKRYQQREMEKGED